MADKHELAQQLDYMLTEIVHCDDDFCPDLREMYSDTMFLVMQIKYPEISQDLQRCLDQNRPDTECTPIFLEGANRANPILFDLIEKKRQAVSPDPLQGYDGIKYDSPFWFEGTGDVWRRVDHGAKMVSIKDCKRIQRDAEQCLADPTKPNDHCFRLYTHSLVCEPGVNCAYLRYPFMTCMKQISITDYNKARECITSVPNYQACTRGYVPQNAAV